MRRIMLLGLLALAFPTVVLASSIDPDNTSAGDPANEFFELQTGTPLTITNFPGTTRTCVGITNATSCSTGNYFGKSTLSNTVDWVLNLIGPTGRIRLAITSLTALTGGACALNGNNSVGTCNFSGTVTAFGTVIPNAGHMFEDSISGTVTRGPNVVNAVGPVTWLLEDLTGKLGNQGGVAPDSHLTVEDVGFCQGTQASSGCGIPDDSGRLRSGHGEASIDVDLEPIPEPGTLGMLGTGLIGLAGMARRKLNFWT